MDPRHPEQAVSRMRDLMKQFDTVEQQMNKAATYGALAGLEREASLVVQEICLVAPRIHEAMMQTSRQRRHDLSRGILIEPQDTVVEAPKLTPEEEEDFARLLVILDNAKKQFKGKDARSKKTGEIYGNLYFMTIKPFSTDNLRYGIVVSMENGKEIISFGNEKVIDFLNDYEPVEKPVEKPVEIASEGVLEVIQAAKANAEEKCVKTEQKEPEKCDETEVAKKKTVRKKKAKK